MTEAEMRALFLLAGIEVGMVYKLANRYWPDCAEYAQVRSESPWWLVSVNGGNVVIGWRKRVISIDWSDTTARGEVTRDDVTRSETMVHAWDYAKAVEYLTRLKPLLSAPSVAVSRAEDRTT